MRLTLSLTLGILGLFGLTMVAVSVGATPFTLAQVLNAFVADEPGAARSIIVDLRLPRALLA
ncbi:MAG: iron ABC transporter permease, partial [Pseudomonadota bacterium]